MKYPWNKAGRLWNILWVLIPLFGWFALTGYGKKIIVELVKGKDKQLPPFGKFWNNFSEGVKIFVFMIPTIIVLGILNVIPLVGWILYAIAVIFFVPWLTINFYVKGTFDALWDLKNAFRVVFDNVVPYLMAMIKTVVFGVVYYIASLILIGIPCLQFGWGYFLADFYRTYK